MIELKDLVGKYKLDAVDFSINTRNETFKDCQVCRFRLNGVVYVAIEDPEDGYRSTMKEIYIDKSAKMKNIFNPIDVVVYHKKGGRKYGHEDDILEVINANSGEIILEVGTDYYYDYYPMYVASFNPKSIGINA